MIVCIQHYPKRVRHLKLLMHFLDIYRAEMYLVIEDSVNSASGMRKCFNEIDKYSHMMVIQDDVLPCKDLIGTANELIKIRPDSFISLFSAYDITTKTLRAGAHWGKIDRAWGLPCYIIPATFIKQYLLFEKNIKDSIVADDVRMSIFLEHIKQPVYVTAPSLVEHLAFASTTLGMQEPVKIENAIKYRIAKNYIGFEKSGLDIDWKHKIKDNVQQLTVGKSIDHIRHLK